MRYVSSECEDIYLLQGEIGRDDKVLFSLKNGKEGLMRLMIPEQRIQNVQGSIDIDITRRRARGADSLDSSRPGTSRNTIDIWGEFLEKIFNLC